MATHSSVLAWRIPGMREPGCRLGGRTESDMTEATQQQQQQQQQQTHFSRGLMWGEKMEDEGENQASDN